MWEWADCHLAAEWWVIVVGIKRDVRECYPGLNSPLVLFFSSLSIQAVLSLFTQPCYLLRILLLSS